MVKNRFKKIIKRSLGLAIALMICMCMFAGTAMADDISVPIADETVSAEYAETESSTWETIGSVSEAEETETVFTETETVSEETTEAAEEVTTEATAGETEEASAATEETEAVSEEEDAGPVETDAPVSVSDGENSAREETIEEERSSEESEEESSDDTEDDADQNEILESDSSEKADEAETEEKEAEIGKHGLRMALKAAPSSGEWPTQTTNAFAGITLNSSIEWSGMDAWWPESNGNISRTAAWEAVGEVSRISDLKAGDVVVWAEGEYAYWVNHIAIVTEVASDGSYFYTADGNMDNATGVGINKRTDFYKRGSEYGKLLVWRNTVNGAAIAKSVDQFTRELVSSNDDSMAVQWSSINWCYCFVVTALLESDETEEYGSLIVEKSISTPAGSIRISKTTSGAASDKEVPFTFTLRVKNTSGTAQTTKYSYTKSDGTTGTISGDGGTLTLKDGQNAVITGIPQGYSYTVSETVNLLYSTTVSKNGATAVTGYQASGTIPAASNSQSFTFTVNIKNGSTNVSGLTLATGLKTDSSGNVSFTLTPGTSGSASKTLSNIPAGYSYTVTETAVTGWTTDPSNRTRTGSIAANDTKTASFANTYAPARETVDFTNTRNTSPVKIVKTSSASAAVKAELKDNKMYSQDFSGAQFSVRVKDKNTGAWSSAKTYTTGSDGSVTVSGLYVGDSVEITETKAPKGYLIPTEKTKNITVAANSNSVSFADEPTFDPGTPVINKVRYTAKGELQKAEAVAGAVFKMEYFDNDNCSGSAVRTWYFKTDADGTFNYTRKYLADGYTSSALFVNSNDDPDIPLGSVKFTEVASPKGYVIYDGSVSGKITQGSNGKAVFSWITSGNGQVLVASDGTATIGDPELTVVIDKVDSGTGKPVKGAKLEILEGSKSIISWTTDGSPKVIRNLLEAGKTYTLRETAAPDSYKKAGDITFKTDAKGNITVVTGDIDTYTTSDGYLAIKMEDVKKVMLPVTGSNDRLWMILIGSLLLAGGFGTAAVLSMRKGSKAKAVIRKAAAGLVAMVAVVTVTVPTFAAGNVQVVRDELPPHSYTAYQLLSGTKLEDDILWDIHVSDDIPDSLWDELGVDVHTRAATDIAHWLADSVKADADGSFAVKTARSVLEEIGIKADATFGSGDTISLEDGYYLITSDDAQPMLVLIGNGETLKINEKSDVPKLEKEIGEVSIDDVVVYGDAADTGLGKVVPYRITGTLPSNYNAYDRYTYNFRDRYDSCLIVDEDSIKVTVVSAAGEAKGDITKYAEITVGKTDMKVGFENLKEAYAVYEEGDSLVVDYEVMIDENASIGAVSNDNYAWIEYTRSPTCEKLGESEPDKCRLYTWELDLNKIAEETGHALAGAEFTIQDGAGRYVNTDGTLTEGQTEASVWTTDGEGHFEVKEVDSGSYTVTEIKAPAGYQKAEAFELTVEVSYQDENNVQLTATASGNYAVVTSVDAKCGITFVQVTDVPTPSRGNPPSTGDASNIALYGGIMLAAIAALAGLLIILKRSRAKSED